MDHTDLELEIGSNSIYSHLLKQDVNNLINGVIYPIFYKAGVRFF